MAVKKTAAELKDESADLAQQIALARKTPVNFALLLGKDGLVLETDLRKGPDILWRTAKKSGGGSKGARGQMSVNGKVITLTCPDDSAPANLPKLAVKFLRERSQPFKVVMVTPSGEFTDGEDEAFEAGGAGVASDVVLPEGLAGAEEDEEDRMRAELRADFAEMADQIAAGRRSLHAGAAKKVDTLASTVEMQLADNPGKAASTMKLLRKAVSDALAFGTRPADDLDDGMVNPDVVAREERKTRRMEGLDALRQKIDALLREIAGA